jgi:hypothetical protein
MKLQIDVKSIVIGLFIGVVVLLVLGAAGGESRLPAGPAGTYQLEVISLDNQVYYSRINTGTGAVETWKYDCEQIPFFSDGSIMRQPKY